MKFNLFNLFNLFNQDAFLKENIQMLNITM